MPLKIASKPTFTRSVTARVPSDGGHDDHTFEATFVLLDTDDLDGMETSTLEGMTSFLQTVVVGLGDILDDDDRPMPWSHSLRDQVIAFVPARTALFETYLTAVGEARVGN